MPWEQRFKNYIDKRYGWYENANYTFYETLTAHDKLKDIRAELKEVDAALIKRRDDVVKEFTTTGKRSD